MVSMLMTTVNVLVTSPLERESLDRIASLSNEIKVECVSHLIVAEKKGDLSAKEQLDFLLSKAEVIWRISCSAVWCDNLSPF